MHKRSLFMFVAFVALGTLTGIVGRRLFAPRQRHLRSKKSGPLRAAKLDGAPMLGREDARVTVVLWGDFDCPHTATTYGILRRLAQDPERDIRLVWKNNPLPLHQRALGKARLAMAAHEQGRFWDAAESLFGSKGSLQDLPLEPEALDLNVDLSRYHDALDSRRVDLRIQDDMVEAARLAVSGTPTLFINGRSIEGAPPEAILSRLLDEAREAADRLLARGVPRASLYERLVSSAPIQGSSKIATLPVEGTRQRVATDGAPAKGPSGAPVEIVMFGDYECAFCKAAVASIEALVEKHHGLVRIVWKNHPSRADERAMLAARAALAAAEQDRFWQMHEWLLANHVGLDRLALETFAERAGFDVRRFRGALDDPRIRSRLEEEIREGNRLVQGELETPTLFVNGRCIVGFQPVDVLSAVVEQEVASNQRYNCQAAQ